jgi:hypothetical protein
LYWCGSVDIVVDMSFNPEKNTGLHLGLEEKRLRFWLDTVPGDIRRLEYDLYKIRRRIIHANVYRTKNKKRYGRFVSLPPFSQEFDYEEWEKFRGSFLSGEDRVERLSEIVASAKKYLPSLIKEYLNLVSSEDILLVSLSGSSFVGPRKPGEYLSDIDLDFLLSVDDNSSNFDIFAQQEDAKNPYHLFGTGCKDSARGENRDIHWLLYPHLPIYSTISEEELRSIVDNLVVSTQERAEEIASLIKKRETILENKFREDLIG